jgi:hypothetical protein
MKNTGTIRSSEEHLGNPKEPLDASALKSARYATLNNRAATEQAKQLVDHVFLQVARADNSERPRGPYGKTKQQLRRGVEGFLGDLLRAAGNEHAKGFVHRSLHAGSFTGEDVGARAFNQLIDRLKALGLIEHARGFQDRFRWDAGGPEVVSRARASRFRATPQLLELAAQFGVAVSDAKAHFIAGLPKQPLQVRRSSRRNEYGQKLRGSGMPLKRTPQTNALEAEVKELNEFFDGFDLRSGTHRGFIRSFNKGDDPHFKWNMGGRLYSPGDDNFQLMKEEDRLRMTIGGEPVCEIDIRASYLTIYLGWFDQQLDWARDPDPYDLPGVPRDIAKTWFVATFGYDKHLQRWPKEATRDYKERRGRNLGKDFPLKVVRQKALEKFPVLKNWGKQKGTWAELMYLESGAVVSTMLRLKRGHQVPSLSVHDSLIVPISKRKMAEELLSQEYFRVTKTKPQLETSTAS